MLQNALYLGMRLAHIVGQSLVHTVGRARALRAQRTDTSFKFRCSLAPYLVRASVMGHTQRTSKAIAALTRPKASNVRIFMIAALGRFSTR